MVDTDEIFHNRKYRRDALERYGFAADGGGYVYAEDILDGQFTLRVTVTDGGVAAKVWDAASDDEYTLHLVESADGGFVGALRAEYGRILQDIADRCFDKPQVFDGKCAEAVIAYARDRYGDELEFLWQKSPGNAVLRRKDNRKWYAALLTVERAKIEPAYGGKLQILDLRAPKEQIGKMVDNVHYFAGYHMNKQHWLTVPLDGRVDEQTLFALIDASYLLAK